MDPVECLKEYISIRTDHPTPDYEKAINYIIHLATQMNLTTQRISLVNNKEALLVIKYGTDTALEPIVFNSHIDVVKVDSEMWDFDPWKGQIKDGKMYGRGTQDMKSLGIMYLFALNQLIQEGNLKRTVILSFVPDEEIMGTEGMFILVQKLVELFPNIAFALDEGIPNEDDKMTIYYGERISWWLRLESYGNTGHGSKYIENHSINKLQAALNDIVDIQKSQKKLLLNEKETQSISDVITININYLHSGTNEFYNVIPGEAFAGLDIRIPPQVDLIKFKAKIQTICLKHDITFSFQNGTENDHLINPVTHSDYKWINRFRKVLKKKGIKETLQIFPATTDAKYLRKYGIPTIGISPIRNTKVLLHDHNEYIPIQSLMEGIDIMCYYQFLKDFAS